MSLAAVRMIAALLMPGHLGERSAVRTRQRSKVSSGGQHELMQALRHAPHAIAARAGDLFVRGGRNSSVRTAAKARSRARNQLKRERREARR